MNYLLAIGIDNYNSNIFPKLNNAKLDAERFIKIMTERYGFTLIQDPLFDSDANRQNILEALNALSLSLLIDDNIVIYFSGHGAMNQKTKKGYWIPNDSRDSISNYIPNSTVIDAIEGIDAKHILLISDSCFAGTFLTQTRNQIPSHYSKLDEQKSRWVFTSGREEKVSDGQPGVGSPFAVAINNFLEKNAEKRFSLIELFSFVSKNTADTSKQQPVFAHIEGVGHEGGQMVFELVDVGPSEENEESKSDIQRIVVPIGIALKMQKLGFKQNSLFGYYKIGNKVVVKKNDGSRDFICSALIYDEMAELIPDIIAVDENTYLARFDGYDKLTITEARNQFAVVTFQRTGVLDTPYMAICRCMGRMVAFSVSEDGVYNNLICWGKNQAEAAALMLIALLEENRLAKVATRQ